MNKSESINELSSALAKAQAEIPVALYDSRNPHFKADYASLSSFLKAAKPHLSKHGLSVSQLPETIDNKHYLTTMLMHSSGQYISSTFCLILTKNDMQGLGSAITYAKRYGLDAMLGIGSDDDDANLAVRVENKKYIPPQINPEPIVNHAPNSSGVSQAQMKRLFALKNAAHWTDEQIKLYYKNKFSIDSSKNLTLDQYKIITDILEKQTPYDTAINQ